MTEPSPVAPLAAWMRARNLKPRHVARATGYNRTTIHKVRCGDRAASGKFKLAFARAYGIPAARELWPADFPVEEEIV